jgi:hypothetical protein
MEKPDPAPAWTQAGGDAIEIYQNGGEPVGSVVGTRRDGPDGDPGFNPYGLPDADSGDFRIRHAAAPRVTSGST